jgi:hypothetical protein
MEQLVVPGKKIDILTPDELHRALRMIQRERVERVRAPATIALDNNGNGQDEVYAVPLGMEFSARRVTLDLTGATDPSTGNVPLNVAGKAVEYLRSGVRIEFAVPQSVNAIPQVPGVQTWGDQQGPYLRNGEVFEVKVRGLTANATLDVTVEGLLYERNRGRERDV